MSPQMYWKYIDYLNCLYLHVPVGNLSGVKWEMCFFCVSQLPLKHSHRVASQSGTL